MSAPTQTQPQARSATDRRDAAQVGGDHYSKLLITPWEALQAWLTPEEFRGYLKGEAIVYIAREASKAGPVDISKARHVLQKLEDVYPAPDPEVTELPTAAPALEAVSREVVEAIADVESTMLTGMPIHEFERASERLRAAMPTLASIAASLSRLKTP